MSPNTAIRADTTADMYDSRFLQGLFDEMQGSYEFVSTLCSFGFNRRWRKQIISRMNLHRGMHICDLMAGTGESWLYLLPHLGRLSAVDFSGNMVAQAEQRKQRLAVDAITVLHEDALSNSLETGSADAVICSYGTKTLSSEDTTRFVGEVSRLLKDNGIVGLVEVSVPHWLPLRLPYLLYLRYVVPFIGMLLLGNPENYRMLYRYTVKFANCSRLQAVFAANGFTVERYSFFWGCATALVATKAPK
jgi:ubiquinone/menaquinone biosynthesis methyltransferase